MAEKTLTEEQVAQLTLLLLYATSWVEPINKIDGGVHRAWKSYRFESLDMLEEQGLINQSKTAKSVYLTYDGEAKAKQLLTVMAGLL